MRIALILLIHPDRVALCQDCLTQNFLGERGKVLLLCEIHRTHGPPAESFNRTAIRNQEFGNTFGLPSTGLTASQIYLGTVVNGGKQHPKNVNGKQG